MDDWTSIEDLLKEAAQVHKTDFSWRGKNLAVPWTELTLEESPSFSALLKGVKTDEMEKDDLMKIGEQIGEEMTRAMINKAQKTLGEPVWSQEQWNRLPLTLRKRIVGEITGQQEEVKARF